MLLLAVINRSKISSDDLRIPAVFAEKKHYEPSTSFIQLNTFPISHEKKQGKLVNLYDEYLEIKTLYQEKKAMLNG